jgi:hypothetical protein
MGKCLSDCVDKSLEKMIYTMNIIFAAVLATMGLFGNPLTLYIYSRGTFKRTSTGFYFSCLAVVNSAALIIFVIRLLMENISQIDISGETNFYCKFFTITMYILSPLSAWIETAASLDRLAATKFTPLFNSIKRRRFQVLMVALITVALITLNVPNIYYFQLIDRLYNSSNNYNRCQVCGIDKKESVYNLLWVNVIDLLISILIPFLLMIFSSFKISLKIFKSKVNVVNLKNSRTNLLREYQFAATIIGRNILFLALNLPMAVFLIIDIHCDLFTFSTNNIHYDLGYAIATFFSYLNYSNTFLVDIVCNRMYRKRFKQIFYKKTVISESIKL